MPRPRYPQDYDGVVAHYPAYNVTCCTRARSTSARRCTRMAAPDGWTRSI
jgi:hypothetical protein